MNIFILGTGRCGTMTFYEACKFIQNYSCGHETNVKAVGRQRLTFPPDHIEADNRLSWFLGRLNKRYGKQAFYVHLSRNKEKVIESFNSRWNNPYGIIKAYSRGILTSRRQNREIIKDYIDTVEANIEHFLEDKPNQMHIQLKDIESAFPVFWEKIGAQGDLNASLETLKNKNNASRNDLKTQLIYVKQNIFG